MELSQVYVEPKEYFNKEMLEAAKEFDRTHELEKAVEESNKAAKSGN